jgi:apolipoprotein N-acyltransferase
MIQANLGARDKAGKRDEFVRRHRDMTREAVQANPDLDLVVWPESSYNAFLPRDRTDLGYVSGFQGVPLLFGAVTGEVREGEREIFNTAVLTSSTGALRSRFDKMRLLLFGETLPFVDTFPQIRGWFPRSATFTKGRTFEHLELDDVSMLPMICYEDIIPAFVRQLWTKAGPADVLVNITNDSWYGDSHEPITHLALATFRSIETRRSLIRSTNTGISAFVDPAGRIVDRTGQWTREILVGEVPIVVDGGATPYLVTGDWLAWCALVAYLVAFVPRRRRADVR